MKLNPSSCMIPVSIRNNSYQVPSTDLAMYYVQYIVANIIVILIPLQCY